MRFETAEEMQAHNSMLILQHRCQTANSRWWLDPVTNAPIDPATTPYLVPAKMMLIVSEISEAMEGHRTNAMDGHCPTHSAVAVELADAVIRIFDLAGAMNLDLAGAFTEKMRYNATRADHTHQRRLADGGKAY